MMQSTNCRHSSPNIMGEIEGLLDSLRVTRVHMLDEESECSSEHCKLENNNFLSKTRSNSNSTGQDNRSSSDIGEHRDAEPEKRRRKFLASLNHLDFLLNELKQATENKAARAPSSATPAGSLRPHRRDSNSPGTQMSSAVSRNRQAPDVRRASKWTNKSADIDAMLRRLDDIEIKASLRTSPVRHPMDDLRRSSMQEATKELENLMASLSDLKIQPQDTVKKSALKTKLCNGCGEEILGGREIISTPGNHWHKEHFVCSVCATPLGSSEFHHSTNNNSFYCKECFLTNVAPRCNRCRNPICGSYVSALSTQWHPDCFTCSECETRFTNGFFYEFDGKPYCEKHYSQRNGYVCVKCSGPIHGRCVTVANRRYHPEHFICTFCSVALSSTNFKQNYNNPYCVQCYSKLFD